MDKNKIEQIRKDIEAYRKAIENAEGVLDAAERELDEATEESFGDGILLEEVLSPDDDPDPLKDVEVDEQEIMQLLSEDKTTSPCAAISDDLPPF